MNSVDKIREIESNLKAYKELYEQLVDIEMTYDNLDWVDVYKPHNIDIELPRAINEVETKIQEIESKLERI